MGLQTGAVTHHSYQTFDAETLRQKCTSTRWPFETVIGVRSGK